MSATATIGRPKIEGLRALNARIPGEHVAALDDVVRAEQKRRGDPGFNRTDALREAVAEYVAARSKRTK